MAIYESYTPYSSTNQDPNGPITLRKEQRDAVNRAKEHFKGSKTKRQFLWNAKMRFGKTISALTLAKELNVKLTLIVTHRPVVNANFREDFDKVFKNMPNWHYASRFENDETGNFTELINVVEDGDDQHLVFFASMQYLRRSAEVNSKPGADPDPVKKEILDTDWNLVVVDEAHEGTTTTLGKRVIEKLTKDKTWMLHLSGTPFNLYTNFTDSEIFTWDYIQEQQAKKNWDPANGENPYITLPTMKIFTYDLAKLRNGLQVPDGATFTLGEFFRTWTGNRKTDKAETPKGELGKFVHEEAVKNFLKLLYSTDEGNNYPFSKEEYQDNFLHTLWVLPGVKEAKALAELLRNDDVFGDFDIINVAGEGDEDEQREDALDLVLKKIGDAPSQTRTITLSCGRLTTGVTVPPWTAVFYLRGSDNTSAATYMQTIFRVQGSHVYNGKMKSECYVFDFAPDRSLTAVAETAKFYNLTQKEKSLASFKSKDSDLNKLKEFISFCPVISLDGGAFVQFDEHQIFEKIHSIYIDRIVQSGYTDNALFNKDAIMSFSEEDLSILDSVDEKKPKRDPSNFQLNKQGMTGKDGEDKDDNEENENEGNDNPSDNESGRRQLSDEEKERRRQQRIELENRRAKLRDITVRIPLLIFGGKFNDEEDITLDNFTRKVDDASWIEFMPKKLTKPMFNKLKAGINANMFVEAGKRICALTREADNLHVEDRVDRIAQIHQWFNNPNKETVLTPWRVVNMHLSDTLGGYTFFNESFDGPNQKEIKIERQDQDGNITVEYEYIDTIQPRFVNHEKVTEEVFGAASERPVLNLNYAKKKDAVLSNDGVLKPADGMDIKILEINSKTGLYPLYATYSLYRNRLQDFIDAGLIDNPENLSIEEEQVVWDDVLQNNIYVISNTKMAEAITRRTLYGFREVERTHIKHQPIIEQAKTDQEGLIKEIQSEGFWNGTTSKKMLQFTAVIGNPPYMEITAKKDTENGQLRRKNIFQLFQEIADAIANITSLIYPGGRWIHQSGKGLEKFGLKQINDTSLEKIIFFPDSNFIFKKVEIADGISIVLKNSKCVHSKFEYTFWSSNNLKISIKRDFPGKQLISLDPKTDKIIKKIRDKVSIQGFKYLHESILPQKLFSIESDFVEKNPNLVRKYKEGDYINEETEMKLFTNDRAGSAGRTKWYITSKPKIEKGDNYYKYLNKWKVVVSSAHPGGHEKRSNKIQIIDNLSAFGRSRVALKTFNTKKEAENFFNYAQSELIKFAFLMSDEALTSLGKVVPDLDNYSNENGFIDFSKENLNKEIYDKFEIDETMQTWIQEFLRNNS